MQIHADVLFCPYGMIYCFYQALVYTLAVSEKMCGLLFVSPVAPREKTPVVCSSGSVDQGSKPESLRVCKRGEGGQHGLQLLLLCSQNHLPGCGWESAKGGSNFAGKATFLGSFFNVYIVKFCSVSPIY